jgi:hypothetical protein
MAIHINLLAEAQAAEEQRRKDPVKRALLVAASLVSLVLVWSASLQFKVMAAKSDFDGLQSKWEAIDKSYQAAVASQRRSLEAEEKLAALEQLTTNRFLWGNALNAIQQTMSGVDAVQVVRLRGEQNYVLTEGTKPRTNGMQVIAGKPGTSTEKIVLTLEALDSSAPPGGQVSKFKESITQVPYFQSALQKTNGVLLTSLSAPQISPQGRNPFVMFTLQCYYPETVR